MTATLEMSARAPSHRTTEEQAVDDAVGLLRDNARTFARLPVVEKQSLLRETKDRLLSVADLWATDGAEAKGLSDAGEEWTAGVMPTMRNLRLLHQTLDQVRTGGPIIPRRNVRTRPDGRVTARVFPTDSIDAALFAGFTVDQLMLPEMDVEKTRAQAGSFYHQDHPEGGVALILGAGNVSSIPPMDALYKMFAEGFVCVVKMNPVNEWVGPHLESAFKPFIDRGYLRVVYGGADVGQYLVEHEAVQDVHITGSNHTHDLIVWGPPGPERDRRMQSNDPVLKKRITSELGNVSPVAIVPADYSDGQLDFVARNVASMITNNASFNCNAAKMLITSKRWPQRDRLLARIKHFLLATPTRKAYYPGAFDRYETLTSGRDQIEKIGAADDTRLPWTLIPGVDPSRPDDPLFLNEPFCSILSETPLEASDPEAFLAEATRFMNDTLWGTLAGTLVVHPKHERSRDVGAALDRAIVELRYGTVAVNHWPAVAYATTSPAWGGHPSATLSDIQSGLGWVHNTYLLEGIEKTVLRGPLTVFPKPLWFCDHRQVAAVGQKMVHLEHTPSWAKVPSIALSALKG